MPTSVIVVGSGAAGLAAAVAAARSGARVTVLERAAVLGGTTALSGGVSWLPANGRTSAIGVEDDPGAAAEYLRALALGDVDHDLVAAFVDAAAETANRVEAWTPVRWNVLPYPDYHADRPGGQAGGRSLEPAAYEAPPALAARVRTSPARLLPVTYDEVLRGAVDRETLDDRKARGVLTLGRSLIAGLLVGAEEAGAAVRIGVRARRLVLRDGAVAGVECDGEALEGRVVLASGGFERDPALVRALLRMPRVAPTGAPGMEGDGLRMAMAAGAALGNLSEAWWCPAFRVPDEVIDGEPFYRLLIGERAQPASVIVDSRGERFADEAQNYNDVGRALHSFDPATFSFPRERSWLVFDASYRRRYTIAPLRPTDPDPAWLVRAGTLPDLARETGVPAAALEATVTRFNEHAEQGEDPVFGRGAYTYGRFLGDRDTPHPNLAPLREPPFYALPVTPGCLGTKGGPRTDADGRVRRVDGGPIPGLYAAGNAAASPFGFAYPGAGGTLGPALVFGVRAGEAAAGD